jgi:hypothetical protein
MKKMFEMTDLVWRGEVLKKEVMYAYNNNIKLFYAYNANY